MSSLHGESFGMSSRRALIGQLQRGRLAAELHVLGERFVRFALSRDLARFPARAFSLFALCHEVALERLQAQAN